MSTPDTRAEVERLLAEQREAFIDSPALDPAWIAGWHAAVDHCVYVLGLAGLLADTRTAEPVPPGPCWHDSGITWPGDGFTPRCELLAGHGGAHISHRNGRGGEAVWTETAPRPAEPAQGDREALAVSGQANDCTHQSATGIDTSWGPEKVWACDHCGYRYRQDGGPIHADTVETVEWGFRTPDGQHYDGTPESRRWTREQAEQAQEHAEADCGPACDTLVRRTRISTPDVVGPWEVVS